MPHSSRQDDTFYKTLLRRYGLRTIASVHHAMCGGVSDAEFLGKLAGKELSEDDLESILECVEYLLDGPVRVDVPVKCDTCGGKLTSLPCVMCRVTGQQPIYRAI